MGVHHFRREHPFLRTGQVYSSGVNIINIPIPTKIGSKMGGEFTNPTQNGINQNGFDNRSPEPSAVARGARCRRPRCATDPRWAPAAGAGPCGS